MRIPKLTTVVLRALIVMHLAVPTTAYAQWAFLSEHKDLKGKTILDIGQLSEESRTNPTTFERTYWVEFRGERTQCVDARTLRLATFRTYAALLLTDGTKTFIAVFSPSLSSLGIELKRVSLVSCPPPP